MTVSSLPRVARTQKHACTGELTSWPTARNLPTVSFIGSKEYFTLQLVAIWLFECGGLGLMTGSFFLFMFTNTTWAVRWRPGVCGMCVIMENCYHMLLSVSVKVKHIPWDPTSDPPPPTPHLRAQTSVFQGWWITELNVQRLSYYGIFTWINWVGFNLLKLLRSNWNLKKRSWTCCWRNLTQVKMFIVSWLFSGVWKIWVHKNVFPSSKLCETSASVIVTAFWNCKPRALPEAILLKSETSFFCWSWPALTLPILLFLSLLFVLLPHRQFDTTYNSFFFPLLFLGVLGLICVCERYV